MESPESAEKNICEFAPERIKVLVFDVDDTVTRGTQGIKREAWEDLFSDKLHALEEARELYEYTGRGDRYNIIAHTIGEPQEQCIENPVVIEWADKFEDHIQQKIRENGIHQDDLAALIDIKNSFKGLVYLLSATPQESVEGNIRYFESVYPELSGLFKEVIGNPMSGGKAGEISKLANALGIEVNEVLMVGDGGSDYNGANGSGSQFVGVVSDPESEKWSNESFPKVASVSELPALLELK